LRAGGRRVRSGDINELTLKDVTLPDGTRIAQAQLDNPADAVMFGDLMVRSRQTEPTEVMAARVAKHRQTAVRPFISMASLR
ncbi:integrase, partial [Xanthomonas vasicola pv. vasculorum NCPPB 1381]